MINFLDIAYEMFQGIRNYGAPKMKYEVYESNTPTNGTNKPIEPTNVISVYTAAKILSSSFSQIPIKITKNDADYQDFKYYYELTYRMNEIQNNQVFWSTLEYWRSTYGNSFVDIRNNKNKLLHPALVKDFRETNGLEFEFLDKLGSTESEWIKSSDLLHFKGMSIDGIFGLPQVTAAKQSMEIMNKASNTIIGFYDNSAMSPLAMESVINTAAGAKATLEGMEEFNNKYSGTYNAGKPMQLPPNTKLTPLQLHFADAELVGTMKYTNSELYTLFGIPPYMTPNYEGALVDIEQQTLSFKTFTLSPIANIYDEEISYKLLTKKERMDKVKITHNMDALVETDLKTKALAYKGLVMSGIATPNEIADIMNFSRIKEPWGNKKYVQSQMIPLNDYEQYSIVGNKQGGVGD